MNNQPAISFAFPKPAPIHDLILNTVANGAWWMPHELRDELLRKHNVLVSDATVTARLRDMRKKAYGAHTVEKRPQGNAFAYRFVRCQNAPAIPTRFESVFPRVAARKGE